MKFVFATIVALVALVAVSGFAAADRLPNQTPENQLFSVDRVIDVTGIVDEKNQMSWVIASPGAIPTGSLGYTQVIADVSYKDSILTNGGKLAENRNFAFDSRDQGTGLYNIETEKVLTYASTEGAHMVGEESLVLSVAGNWAAAENTIRCVFSDNSRGLPAFCNIVSAKSSLVNINSAQISTKGQIRATAATAGIPAELNYRIAVTPDANSGSGFAEGTVATAFAGGIMEARGWGDYTHGYFTHDEDALDAGLGAGSHASHDHSAEPYYFNSWNQTSATNSWKDTTTVTGGIKNFQKALAYQSGFKI